MTEAILGNAVHRPVCIPDQEAHRVFGMEVIAGVHIRVSTHDAVRGQVRRVDRMGV